MTQFLSTQFKPSKLALLIAATLSFSTTVNAQEDTVQADNNLKIQQGKSAEKIQDDDIERIYETASKRRKSLQESPVAVSVVRAEDIDRAKIQDINDLQKYRSNFDNVFSLSSPSRFSAYS